MKYNKTFEMLDEKLKENGAFITVTNDKGESNTMTIGWALMGHTWHLPILTVFVRYSRHTFEFIKDATAFTVSVPKMGELKKELAFMGTKSGRDFDKYKETNLTLKDGVRGEKYKVIEECELFYECDIAYSQSMDPHLIRHDTIKKSYQSNNDYHILYYGEILESYTK